MEEIVRLDGQNMSFSSCMVNMNIINNNTNTNNNDMLFEDFDEEINNSYVNIHLFRSFLQNPQFINDMNFELFINFLNNLPYDKSINGTVSLLEACINNINRFNPNLVDEILLKIISKLCYTNDVIIGNETLFMSFNMNYIEHNIIDETSVFKSVILPLINSNNIELMQKVTNLIFKHSQEEFCFLFLRTCFEFRDMIPQNFLYNMFGIGERNEAHNTIKEFIINDIQNIIVLLVYNCNNYKNIDFILMYLNEIVNENKNVILEIFDNGILTYNVTHRWSVSEHIIDIENIKNLELRLFIQNLMNGIPTPIIEKSTIVVNQKLQELLLNFNNIINDKIKLYNLSNQEEIDDIMMFNRYYDDMNEVANEIMILCEYDNNTEYILQKLLEINFMNGRFVSEAINIFFTQYHKIQNTELKKIYIELINRENLDFNDILNFINNYEKFDDYLKFSIQEKFSKIALKLFENFIQRPSMYKYELIVLHMLIETIHKNKIDEILLPIFIENSESLNKEQQMLIKKYLFANLYAHKDRSINKCFKINNKQYELCNAKKINKLTLIKCLDLFYNNIEYFYESKEDTESITIMNLLHIMNVVDNLECSLEEKLQLKTKIFLDIEQILVNPNIEITIEKDEAKMFLFAEITRAIVQNPEIIQCFLTDIKEEETTKKMIFKPMMFPLKLKNKKNNEVIFEVLSVLNKEDKIKIQKFFMDFLDINLKHGNTGLLNIYCKNIKKFDKEFQQIILCKAFECGIKDFDITSSKTQQK